jgi:hypothetical protein
LREIRKHLPKLKGRPIAIAVNPRVAEELLTGSKQALGELNEEIGRDIEVRARPGIHQERFELTVLEQGSPADLDLVWLQDRHPDAPKTDDPQPKRNGRRRGRGRTEVLVAEGEIDPSPVDVEVPVDVVAPVDVDVESDEESAKPLAEALPSESGLPTNPPEAIEAAAAESTTAGSAPTAETESDPGAESTETTQAVDSEAETGIIPRSE